MRLLGRFGSGRPSTTRLGASTSLEQLEGAKIDRPNDQPRSDRLENVRLEERSNIDVLAGAKKSTRRRIVRASQTKTQTPRDDKSLVNIARHTSLGIDHVPDRNVLPGSVTEDGGTILSACP